VEGQDIWGQGDIIHHLWSQFLKKPHMARIGICKTDHDALERISIKFGNYIWLTKQCLSMVQCYPAYISR